MQMKLIALFVLLIISPALHAQFSINGRITDSENSESIIGATMLIEGTQTGAVTDIDGNFIIPDLKKGTFTLKVSLVGYESTSASVLIDSEDVMITIRLKSRSQELKGAEISATRITETENAVLAEMRNAQQVVNGISAQQISRSQDRVATDVMRRIPGVTVVEDKFIMVRGLSERYNIVLLNEAVAPGVEPDKKAFSFDLIPSGLLDRILIYKTGAPDLPGEFAGGAIKIFTKNIPDENIVQLNYSSSWHAGITGERYFAANSGTKDWMGFDDGSRSLPASFPVKINEQYFGEDLSKIGKLLPNTWTLRDKTASPDQRLALMFARSFNIGKIKAGNITSVNYSRVTDIKTRTIANYNEYNHGLQRSELIYQYRDTISSEKAAAGIISNWSFMPGSGHKIEFHNMLNQSGVNQTMVREGANMESDSYFRNYSVRYNERTLYTGQLSGEHDINNTSLSWIAGLNSGKTSDPDFRRFQTNRPLGKPEMPFSIVVAPNYSLDQLGRFYSVMYENTVSGGINVSQKVKFAKGKVEPQIKAGVFYEQKEREFDARWISYIKSLSDQFDNSLLVLPVEQALSMQNINPVTGFKITEGTNFHDSYENYSELMSAYLSLSFPLGKRINVSGGTRIEDHIMEQATRNDRGDPEHTALETHFVLPSVNISFQVNTSSLLRIAYFKSLNRPQFREIERYSYFDFVNNELLRGNPALKTATVDNFDLRWEYYPDEGEFISAGIFYKNFTNPIERYSTTGAGGGTRSYKLDNAVKAESAGVEAELRKSLKDLFSSVLLRRLSLTMNGSYIYSRVHLGSKAVYQKENRPMMDQSPFVVNGGIFYHDPDRNWQFSLMYNVIGRRLYAVGSDKAQPDIYEMPRHLLDVSVTKSFGKHFEVKAGIKDLINNHFRIMQDVNGDGLFVNNVDQTLESYQPGSYYTLGLTFKY